MNEKVHFYSPGDMSSYYSLKKATPVIESFSEDKVYADINEVIELYHIRQFIDNGITLKDWSEDFITKTGCFYKKIANFFKSIDQNHLVTIYNSVEFDYKETFWKIIDAFDIKGILNEENLKAVAKGDQFTLRFILRCGKIVKQNNKILSELLKKHEKTAEWLLDHYVAKHYMIPKEPVFFPSAISLVEKEEIISKYLDRGLDTNLNYVQLVINAKDDKVNFAISSRTRLKAQKLEQELIQHYFKPEMGMPIRTSVEMSREEGIEPVFCYTTEEGFIVCKYDANLIDKLSNSDIIYFFQYGFEYLTRMGFINLISMSSEEGVMERDMGLSAKDTYRENIDFKIKDQLAVVQMAAMINILKETSKRVEDAIMSFYEDHLREKYGYPAQKITVPIAEGSYVEKIRALAPEMDAVVKQYNLYSKEGEIDPELLALESSIKVTDSASCVDKKYFVANESNTDLKILFNLLMGDQSMLSYVEPYKAEPYHTFFLLLTTMKPIDCSKYEQWQLNRLQPLIDKGIVKIGENSILQVLDWPKIVVLQHLYKYKACPFWYYPVEMQKAILEMEEAGWVSCCKKLLTSEEQKYFSFILNNEKYTNAYAIRNRYAHGSNAPADDEKQHEIAYTRLLMMFVLLLLKIEDDLLIKVALENNTVKS